MLNISQPSFHFFFNLIYTKKRKHRFSFKHFVFAKAMDVLSCCRIVCMSVPDASDLQPARRGFFSFPLLPLVPVSSLIVLSDVCLE